MDEGCYHIGVDDGDDDGDRCGGLHDDGVDGDGFPSANSPSRHLLEARVWWISWSGGWSLPRFRSNGFSLICWSAWALRTLVR